ncbi:hypothetical protein CVB78_004431 [Escherichia coli]|nr:hypothetical protein [Escherichia coli]
MLKDYQSIYDFIIAHTKRTPEGLIKIVEDGKGRFLNRQELKRLCYELKKQIENRQVKLFVKKDCIIIEGL